MATISKQRILLVFLLVLAALTILVVFPNAFRSIVEWDFRWDWMDMSTMRKADRVLYLFVIIATISGLIYLGIGTNRKLTKG